MPQITGNPPEVQSHPPKFFLSMSGFIHYVQSVSLYGICWRCSLGSVPSRVSVGGDKFQV